MIKIIVSHARVICFLLISLVIGCVNININPAASICETTKDLSKTDVDTFDTAAKSYITLMNDTDYNGLYKVLSTNAKEIISKRDIQAVINQIKSNYGDLKDVRLKDVFRLSTTSNKQAALCTNSLSDKKNSYSVYVLPDSQKFVTTIHEVNVGSYGRFYIIMFLVSEENNLKIRAFYFQPSGIGERDADYYLGQAEKQLAQGSNRSAFLYYSIGLQFLPNNQLVSTQYVREVKGKMDAVTVSNLSQNVEEKWTTSTGDVFTVYRVGPTVIHNETGLSINYITESVSNVPQIEKESKELASYIKTAFPEYSTAFDFILIEATEKISADSSIPSYRASYHFSEL
ncbi:MAG: hypothetical protein HZB68_02435 [Candidatus Aenigmarchaeota archaeon]|nr:hypothetical protein [Candidatus Aenigmarchaeota archaeon]